MNKPVVSILSITYNHEKYIAQAIDSFLMQETDFDFEIVIGEDCSTDNTRQIINQYKEKYPEKIKLLTSASNVGPNHNFLRTFEACQGKYIALCEGDDYWIDPLKLQKQVDFIDNEINVSLVCTDFIFLYNNGETENVNEPKKTKFVTKDLTLDWIPSTRTYLFKNYKEDMIYFLNKYKIPGGDRAVAFFCSLKGDIIKMPFYSAVHRMTGIGVWTKTLNNSKNPNGVIVNRVANWISFYENTSKIGFKKKYLYEAI